MSLDVRVLPKKKKYTVFWCLKPLTIFHLYGGSNDIKDMKMLFITIQTENLERNKNE